MIHHDGIHQAVSFPHGLAKPRTQDKESRPRNVIKHGSGSSIIISRYVKLVPAGICSHGIFREREAPTTVDFNITNDLDLPRRPRNAYLALSISI